MGAGQVGLCRLLIILSTRLSPSTRDGEMRICVVKRRWVKVNVPLYHRRPSLIIWRDLGKGIMIPVRHTNQVPSPRSAWAYAVRTRQACCWQSEAYHEAARQSTRFLTRFGETAVNHPPRPRLVRAEGSVECL